MFEIWILPSVKPTSYWCLEGTNYLMDSSRGSYESCQCSSDRCILNHLRVQLMKNHLHLKYGASSLNTETQSVKASPWFNQVCFGAVSWALGRLFASRVGERHWHTWACPSVCSESGWAQHTAGHALATGCPDTPLQCRVPGAAITATDGAAQETTTGYHPALLRPYIS